MTYDEMLEILLRELISEAKDFHKITISEDIAGKRDLLRSLMNLRPPVPISSDFIKIQDQLLSFEPERKDITDPNLLPKINEQFQNSHVPFAGKLILWKGDMTSSPCLITYVKSYLIPFLDNPNFLRLIDELDLFYKEGAAERPNIGHGCRQPQTRRIGTFFLQTVSISQHC